MAAAASPPVPIIRFIKEGCADDLEAIPARIRKYVFKNFRQHQVAVLVSDMSGFTRLTRKYGIVHFASIIARIRQLFLPYFHIHHAMLITTEADTFNVLFPSVEDAVKAALAMQRITRMYNESLPAERAHFSLPLEGVGIDYGPGPLLDQSGKLLGSTFENAHQLGEELCKGNMIAVSSGAREHVEKCALFKGATFKALAADPDDRTMVKAMEDMGGAFVLCMENAQEVELVGVDDDRYLQRALLAFAGRHSLELSTPDLERLDCSLRERHMLQRAALMLSFSFENTHDPESELILKFECIQRISNVWSRHNARVEEDVLYLFTDPVVAILAALECRTTMRQWRQERSDAAQPCVHIPGYGIHMGDVLVIDGTDIHWGDPVNSASKLGQEIASDEEVIISQPTFLACQHDVRLQGLRFEQFHVTISGVQFHPYKVFDEAHQHAPQPQGSLAFPSDVQVMRASILEKFCKSGLVKDAAIDRSVLHTLLKALDPQFPDEDFEAMVSHLGRASMQDIILPDFVDWALEATRREKLPAGPP